MVGILLNQNKQVLTKKDQKLLEEEKKEILQKLNEIEDLIDTAHNVFNYVIDDELIDGCIYELNSLYKKYSYYIKICKDRGIVCDGLDRSEKRYSYY